MDPLFDSVTDVGTGHRKNDFLFLFSVIFLPSIKRDGFSFHFFSFQPWFRILHNTRCPIRLSTLVQVHSLDFGCKQLKNESHCFLHWCCLLMFVTRVHVVISRHPTVLGSIRKMLIFRISSIPFILCDRCERNPDVMNDILKRNTHERLVSSTFTFDRIRCRFHPSSNTVALSSSSHSHSHLLTNNIINWPGSPTGSILTFPALIYWNNIVHLTVILEDTRLLWIPWMLGILTWAVRTRGD